MTGSGPLIELQGAWLDNAGAELMLRTVTARLGERLADVRFAIDPAFGSFAKRAQLGLLQLFPRTAPGAGVLAPLAEAARRGGGRRVGAYLESYGVVTRDEPDALVDLSGFAFSDQWGSRKARQRADRAARYHRAGRPVVFLPQAWGPFGDKAVAREVRRIVAAADLVYARDARSFRELRDLVGERPGLRRAPDLTFDSPRLTESAAPPGLVVVPNGRLVEQGSWSPDDYVALMADVAIGLEPELGDPVVLLHTAEPRDRTLGTAIADRTGGRVVADADPVRL